MADIALFIRLLWHPANRMDRLYCSTAEARRGP